MRHSWLCVVGMTTQLVNNSGGDSKGRGLGIYPPPAAAVCVPPGGNGGGGSRGRGHGLIRLTTLDSTMLVIEAGLGRADLI